MPYRFDRKRIGGRVIIYVRDDVPSKQLIKYKLLGDMEDVFIEVHLRKTKWLIFGAYRPPCQSVEYFFKNVGFALDTCKQTHEKFLLLEILIRKILNQFCLFLTNYDCNDLVKDKTCLKK